MNAYLPTLFKWSDGAFHPVKKIVGGQFVEGEYYRLEPREERSGATHRHFFAAINEAWKNLPEGEKRYPSPDHLRRWALCKAGFADERTIVCDSARDAKQFAAVARNLDGYAVITISDKVVRIFTAKSQSVRHMNKEEFARSKTAVLDIVSGLIGVTRSTLQAQKEPA